MKRLLYTLLALAAAVGCTKDAEVTTPSNVGEAVSFTITDDLTRAHKTAWEAGDEIAIFVGDATTATCYVVQADGATLAVDTDATPIEPSDSDVTYNAYYPYKIGNTQEQYLVDATQDVLKAAAAVAANGYAVTLTFTHVNSYITINYSGMTSLSITDGSGVSIVNQTFDVSCDSYSFYHAAVSADDLTDYTICVNNGYFTSATTDDITAWAAGTPYIYTLYASCDINYANGICEIYTTKGLAAFRDMVNDGTTSEDPTIIGAKNVAAIISAANNSKAIIKGKLMTNIDIDDESNWTPIGSYGIDMNYYAGEFDGNGFEVRNLTINASAGYKGLFGYILGATIENLGVTGSVTVSGDNYVGGVVGCANNGSKITNCYNKASVVSGCQDVGGVVGCINDTSSTISNCYNTGAVTGSNNNVGGIVGYALSNIICCYNMGDVYSTGIGVGGVAGFCFRSTILNCFNIGDVTGSNSVGGVMGYCFNYACNIYNSYNLGSVKSTSSSTYYAGGIVGIAYIALKINNCYNAGVVSNSNGTTYCGSIAGRTTNITASNCYYLDTTASGITFSSGTTEKTADVMKSSDFVDDLDSGIDSVNQALQDESSSDTANNWQFNYNTYPTLTGLMFNDSSND